MNHLIKPNPTDSSLAIQGLARLNNQQIFSIQPKSNTAIEKALQQILEHFSQGHAIQIHAVELEYTTQEAADWLGISRPTFVKILESGSLPFRKIGNQRRVLFTDLQAFQTEQRRKAVALMTQLHQEMGLYD